MLDTCILHNTTSLASSKPSDAPQDQPTEPRNISSETLRSPEEIPVDTGLRPRSGSAPGDHVELRVG